MLGLMQDWPLLCHRIIDYAANNAGERPVISRSIEGPMHETNYAEIRKRALRVAQRLERDGLRVGDRVATLAWNTWRHLETWYGILGVGAVYHTLTDPGKDCRSHADHRTHDRLLRCGAYAGNLAAQRRTL
jgi:fatty-acyl-CoA synthase